MNTTINDRIIFLIENLSKNQSDFANKIGRSSQTISNLINKGNKPGAEVLEAILKAFPQIEALWLVCGIGEMQRNNKGNDNEKEQIAGLKRENEILIQNNEALRKNQERLWDIVDKISSKHKPYTDKTSQPFFSASTDVLSGVRALD